jgi:predicted DNA-binding transcriptional regulator AlpA
MVDPISQSLVSVGSAPFAADPSLLVSQPRVDELPTAPSAPKRLPDSIVNSRVRLLTLKQVAELFGVSKLWFWRHRGDFPTPLRLGDARNPKSPIRWRESDIEAYLNKMKVATDEQRVGNQVPGSAK